MLVAIVDYSSTGATYLDPVSLLMAHQHGLISYQYRYRAIVHCGDDFVSSDHSGEDIDGGDPDL